MKTKLFISGLFLLTLAACRKELPPIPDADAPVFYSNVSGTGLNFNLKAGINNVHFSDEVNTLNQVKVYSGMLQNSDTLFRLNFFGGEVFQALNAESFQSTMSIVPVSMGDQPLATLNTEDWTNSLYDDVTCVINHSPDVTVFDFYEPGVFSVKVLAHRNGVAYEESNVVVLGYDNPYKFELQGTINASGPGIILEGKILNNESPIQKVEWTCGSNAQTTMGNTMVQFPPAGSSNVMTAKVFFTDGTTRIRTIGLGLQSEPKVEDVVYPLEVASIVNFSKKFELIMEVNGQTYHSRPVTEFSQGNPTLHVSSIKIYRDPVTKAEAYLLKASGLVYVKNMTTQEVLPLQLDLQIGLPKSF